LRVLEPHPVIELSRYVIEPLRKDDNYILYRGRSKYDASQVLVLSPRAEYPAPEILKRLEHEYSLGVILDDALTQITVQDSGIGFDPLSVERIFDAFQTTKSGGLRMGLSISRSIVESHGARLWATANDGPGAIFHLTL
jgi:signal transduction histidine kinase